MRVVPEEFRARECACAAQQWHKANTVAAGCAGRGSGAGGCKPAISSSVGNKSIVITGVSFTLPGVVTPGQRMMSGTRTPPS